MKNKKGFSKAIKQLNGSSLLWWLRAVFSHVDIRFCYVTDKGNWYNERANSKIGVSPAFRIG